MRLLPFAFAALVALPGCDTRTPEPKASVDGAWMQLPAVPGRPGAAYFTLRSNNDPTKLIRVTSPRVGRIELHTSVAEQGVTRMRPLENPVFADGKLVFAPGGNHAMLYGIDPALRPGDKIPLTFTLDPVAPITVDAEVRAFGEGHAGH